jgi:hypothetical protein
MLEVKEQYIELNSTSINNEHKEKLITVLKKEELNNVLVKVEDKAADIEDLASFLEKIFQTSNGLACFVGVKELMNSPSLERKNYVIALPTEHEGVEAIMMNILENEFLKGE